MVRLVLRRHDVGTVIKFNVVAWQDKEALARHKQHERRHTAFNTIGDAMAGLHVYVHGR